MDHVPLDPAPTLPTRATLTVLVGRVTTIKLAYWASLTLLEAGLPLVVPGRFEERFAVSVSAVVVASLVACLWARAAARGRDRRAGMLSRSLPAIATTFAATTVVASPASLPLLILERQRSLDGCGFGTCHGEALLLWIAVLVIGTIAIPTAFASALPPPPDA